jgi:orotidine-5'-phosphate decarboxylase
VESGEKVRKTRDRGLILAADLENLRELENLLSDLNFTDQDARLTCVKVGFSLGLRYGLEKVVDLITNYLSSEDVPIIYDHQKAGTDIPRMGKPFAKLCKEVGIDEIIIFPQSGPVTLQAFVEAAQEEDLVPIVGITMTHSSYLVSEGGYIADLAQTKIFNRALELGVRDFVLPGTKPEIIKKYSDLVVECGDEKVNIMSPGIGAQGGKIADFLKASWPQNAYAIVGSAIYKAEDPREAFDDFVEQLNQED